MVFPITTVLIVAQLLAIWLLRKYFVTDFIHLGSKFLTKPHIIWLYSIVTLPGLLIHEIAHFLTAAFLGARTGKIELLPIITDSGNVEFGSVQVEKVDPLRLSIIGMAPMLIGLPIIGWMSVKMPDNPWLWGYLIFCASVHLLPSKRDLTYWPIIVPLMMILSWLAIQFATQYLLESMMWGLLTSIIGLIIGIILLNVGKRIVS